LTLKALVILNDNNAIKDLGDLLKIARAEGQKLFHTRENIQVLEVFHSHLVNGFVVVIGDERSNNRSGVTKEEK